MKKALQALCLSLVLSSLFLIEVKAQAPQKMSYQAVIRNNTELVANKQIGMRISILQGSSNSNVVYVETHTPVSNSNGLVTFEIGSGTILSGSFSSIPWASGSVFIKIETDISGGVNYSIESTQQLLSVPYALYAEVAGNGATGADGKTILSGTIDPTAEGTNGDFYLNTTTQKLFGPKTNGNWGNAVSLVGAQGSQGIAGQAGTNGIDGKTILSGAIDPAAEGTNGDFYLNTTTQKLFGPKTNGNWGNGVSLVGVQGSQGIAGQAGTNGIDGKTILSGTIDPTTEGANGDFYLNTTTQKLFGPKTNGNWGNAVSLVGAQGSQGIAGQAGTNGIDGKTILSGAIDPAAEGTNGDFYLNTTTQKLFGPKTNGNWGNAVSLVGAQGSQGIAGQAGTNGIDGKTILSGTIDPTAEGTNGDFYLNTTTQKLFGPKTNGNWGNGVSLVGVQGSQGIAGQAGTNGIDGKTILSGTIDPTAEGTNGDFYLNTTTQKLFGPKVNGNWGNGVSLIGSAGGWGLSGNTGTDATNNFIGTTDAQTLNFRVNNQRAGRIEASTGNTFYGRQAGDVNTTGNLNTGIGRSTLSVNTTGNDNTALGWSSLSLNINGSNNTALGELTLPKNVSGNANTAVGVTALRDNTTACCNTGVGRSALIGNTTGIENTAVGLNALSTNITGNTNTAVGSRADVGSNNLTNATALGANAVVDASNTMRFGDGNVVGWGFGASPVLGADAIRVGTDATNGNGATLSLGGTWTNTSDKNKKENFVLVDGVLLLSKIAQLPVTRWNYKGESALVTHIGPMAQDFHQLFQVGNDDKSISTIDPAGIALAAIQQLMKENEELKKTIKDLSQANEQFQLRFETLQVEYDKRLKKIEELLIVSGK